MHLGLSDGSALSSIEVSSPSHSGVSTYSAPSFGDSVWERCEISPPPALAPPNIGRAEQGRLDAPVGRLLHVGVRLPPPRPILSETAMTARAAMTGARIGADAKLSPPAPRPEAAGSADQELFVAHSAVSTETRSHLGVGQTMAPLTVPSGPLSPPCLARRCPPIYLWAPFPESEPDTDSLPRPESLENAGLLAEPCTGFDNFQASETTPSPEALNEGPSADEAGEVVALAEATPGTTRVSLAPARRLRGIPLRLRSFQVPDAESEERAGPHTEPAAEQAEQAEPEQTWRANTCESAAGPLDAWCTFFEDAVRPLKPARKSTATKRMTWRAAQVAAMAESERLDHPGEERGCVDDLDWTPKSELLTQHADHEHGESLENALPSRNRVRAVRDTSSDSDSDYWTSSAHHRFGSEFGESVQEDGDSEQHGRRPHYHGPGCVRSLSPFSPGKATSASARLKRVLDLRGLLSQGRPGRGRSSRPRVTLSLDASGGPSWLGDSPAKEEGSEGSGSLLFSSAKVQVDWTSSRQSCLPEGRQV